MFEVKDGILNTKKGARPFKVRIHGNARTSSFATHEAAAKARAEAHIEAMAAAADIQDGWRKHSSTTEIEA